jgi:hypothetical protein
MRFEFSALSTGASKDTSLFCRIHQESGPGDSPTDASGRRPSSDGLQPVPGQSPIDHLPHLEIGPVIDITAPAQADLWKDGYVTMGELVQSMRNRGMTDAEFKKLDAIQSAAKYNFDQPTLEQLRAVGPKGMIDEDMRYMYVYFNRLSGGKGNITTKDIEDYDNRALRDPGMAPVQR